MSIQQQAYECEAHVERLFQAVQEYVRAFGEACPMRILSAKFSKSFRAHGGLALIIEELRNNGRIEVWLYRSGAKVVTLGGIQVKDAVKL